MIVQGSLIEAIVELHDAGVKMIALVVDEPAAPNPDGQFRPGVRSQIAVLNTCRSLGVPVWAVLFNPALDRGVATQPLNPELGAADLTIVKSTLSVHNKAKPNLKTKLEEAGITHVVIMGWFSDQCVKLAAIGGSEQWDGKNPGPGLTSWGYKILTCAKIQRVDVVSWAAAANVTCYTSI